MTSCAMAPSIPVFAQLLRRLAARAAWFVPAGMLLNHLRSQPGWTLAGTVGGRSPRCNGAGRATTSASSRGKKLVRKIARRVWR